MDGHYRGSRLGSLALCSLALLDDCLGLLFVKYLGLLGQWREKEECFSVLVSMEVLLTGEERRFWNEATQKLSLTFDRIMLVPRTPNAEHHSIASVQFCITHQTHGH